MARTKQKGSLKKKVAAITAVTLAAILAIGSAFAWHDFSQSAINRTRGIVSPDVLLHDDFADEWIDGERQKDVYVENTGDIDTIVRIRFSEFLQIGNDKVVGTNSKDPKTWEVHTFNPGLPGHVASKAHEYFSWNMDGSDKVYLTDTSEMGYFEYDEADYTFAQAPAPKATGVMYSDELGPNGQPYSKTLPEATVISMADYMADKPAIDGGDGCWIVDTDGWCYWSKQLKPGEATNMLLSSIEMIKNPNDNYAYNIYVDLQACNATEIGDMIGKGMTKEAEDELINNMLGLINIDSINFPDSVFMNAVKNGYTNHLGVETFAAADKNGDGKLSEAERNAIISISMRGESAANRGILTSVEGIKHFPNLISINFNANNLTELDLTNNPNIIYMDLRYNSLNSLDLTVLPKLETLIISSNNIPSVDLSENPELVYFSADDNNFTGLIDVSNNPKLKTFVASNNAITSVDFSNNPLLTQLIVSVTGVTSLDLSQTPLLTDLRAADTALTSLDVSYTPNLATLYCYGANITTLDVSMTSILVTGQFRIQNNGMTSLTVNATQDAAGIGKHATYVKAGNPGIVVTVAP